MIVLLAALLTLSLCVCSFCVLQELLERCDEKTGGASKVSMEVMRSVLVTMQRGQARRHDGRR